MCGEIISTFSVIHSGIDCLTIAPNNGKLKIAAAIPYNHLSQKNNCLVVDQSSGMIKGSVPPSFVTRCVTMGRLLVSVSTVPSRTCTAS